MKCVVCKKDFGDNELNFERHIESKDHVYAVYLAGKNLPILENPYYGMKKLREKKNV